MKEKEICMVLTLYYPHQRWIQNFKGGSFRREYGERGTTAYNGSLWDLPPAGSRGQPLVKGSGAKPPEAESFLAFA